MVLNEGNEAEFKRLVANGANLNHKNEHGNSAIILAAEKGNHQILSLKMSFWH